MSEYYTGEDKGLKNANNQKIIALSLLMLSTSTVCAGLGSLQVNSALGEPFSGTVVVTGDEAKAALKGKPAVAGANLQVKVTPQGQNAVIHLRSSHAVQDPMLSFSLVAGNQGRQYVALLDPSSGEQQEADKTKNKGKQQTSNSKQKRHSESRAKAALSNELASEQAVGEYYVDKNETLMDVARKVRPQGLTLAQTMHALVAANPHAFRNGNPDVMYHNAKLNIPSAMQLNRLSKVKKTATVKGEIASERRVNAKQEIPHPASIEAVNQRVDQNNNIHSASSVENISSAPITASVPAEAVSSPITEAASVVKAESVEPQIKSTAQPTQSTQPSAKPAPAEEESLLPDWWIYALAGVGGVLLIAALIWLRSRKKKADTEEIDDEKIDDDDNDIIFEDTPVIQNKVSYNSESRNKTEIEAKINTTDTVKHSQTETDEDWSWLAKNEMPAQEISESKSALVKNKEDTAITPKEQTKKTSVTTKLKPHDDDEEWLNFSYDDKPAVSSKSDKAGTEKKDYDLSWLDQLETAKQPEFTEVQPVAISQEKAVDIENMEWMVTDEDHPEISEEKLVEPESLSHSPTEGINTISFENKSLTNEVEIERPVQEIVQGKEINDAIDLPMDMQWDFDSKLDDEPKPINFEQVNAEQQTISQTSVSPDRLAFAEKNDSLTVDIDWDILEPSHEDVALGLSSEEKTVNLDNKKITPNIVASDNAETQISQPKVEKVGTPPLDLTLSDDFELPSSKEVEIQVEKTPVINAESTSVFATGAGIQDWERESPEPKSDQPLTPEQLAVPLQAKLELAKMYLEMDDAVTARQTLRELVEEANGSILAEAQNLLHQLGG